MISPPELTSAAVSFAVGGSSIGEHLQHGCQSDSDCTRPTLRVPPQKVFGPSKPTPNTTSEGTWSSRFPRHFQIQLLLMMCEGHKEEPSNDREVLNRKLISEGSSAPLPQLDSSGRLSSSILATEDGDTGMHHCELTYKGAQETGKPPIGPRPSVCSVPLIISTHLLEHTCHSSVVSHPAGNDI